MQINNLEDKGWEAMNALLDKEMPQEKKRRGFIFWWFAGALLVIGALSFLWMAFTQDNDTNLKNTKEQVALNHQTPLSVPSQSNEIVQHDEVKTQIEEEYDISEAKNIGTNADFRKSSTTYGTRSNAVKNISNSNSLLPEAKENSKYSNKNSLEMPLAESTNVKVSENTNAEIVEPVISLGKLVADDKPELQIYSTLQSRQLILLNNEVKKEKPLLNITPVKNWKVLSELNAFGTYALQNQSGGIGFESLVSIRNMHTPFVFSTGFGYQRFNFLMREEVIVDKGDGANHPTNNAPRYSTSKHKIDYLTIPVKFTYQRNRWQTGLGLKYGFQLKEPSQKFTNQILWVTSHLGYRVTRNLTVIGGINLDVYQKSPKALLTSYSEKDLSKLPMNHVQVGLSFSF